MGDSDPENRGQIRGNTLTDEVAFNDRMAAKDREYLDAWDKLSTMQKEEMRRLGIDGPEKCQFETQSEPFREDTPEPDLDADETKHDDVVFLLLILEAEKNSKAAIRVMLKAMGVNPFASESDDLLAKPFGKSKQFINTIRKRLEGQLEVDLFAGKDAEASETYSTTNTSATKLWN